MNVVPSAESTVTEPKAAVAERKRLAAILEYAEDAVVSKTLDGTIIGWNHGAERLYGYTAEEMLGHSIAVLSPPDHHREYLRLMEQVRNGETVPAFDTVRRRKDGTLVNVSVGFMPIETRDGEVVGAAKSSHDITRIKKLEAQFIEAQKMEVIGQLSAGVAHDFNNLLSVIMGYSDFIASETAPGSPIRGFAEEIRHASQRAAGLTRQLLVFSRRQKVQMVVLDLNDVVKDLEKMLRQLIDENILLTIVPGLHTGRVKADSGYVGQVLMNLVVNARDAMPDGGKLSIGLFDATLDHGYANGHRDVNPGEYVMLSVSDTGTGMTAEVQAHLFEAFFTTKPKGKGTGLGLATCQTIMQQSGGHIGVYSEVGKGSTFKAYFPRVDQPLDAAVKSTPASPLPRGTETLLVVEDDAAVRRLTRSILEGQGYEVLSAANGRDALQVAKERKGSAINLVITDVVMPLMGGKVMSDCLKLTNPNLKILFTSGYTDDAIGLHGVLDAGVEFLPKPYSPTALARKIRSLLDAEQNPARRDAEVVLE